MAKNKMNTNRKRWILLILDIDEAIKDNISELYHLKENLFIFYGYHFQKQRAAFPVAVFPNP